jgi:hypothetical protein
LLRLSSVETLKKLDFQISILSLEGTNLVDESAAVQSGYLASAHVWHFEVSVQQEIKTKSQIFARIVNSNVEVQLLFTEDEPISQSEPESKIKARLKKIAT